ncbi:MAG TPA: hypothetical protein PLO53_00840 [Candidatus Hydrogenedentes bacterium]|nr:hypothetical protein [Candidatus Hydrogenedentota bacterium]
MLFPGAKSDAAAANPITQPAMPSRHIEHVTYIKLPPGAYTEAYGLPIDTVKTTT